MNDEDRVFTVRAGDNHYTAASWYCDGGGGDTNCPAPPPEDDQMHFDLWAQFLVFKGVQCERFDNSTAWEKALIGKFGVWWRGHWTSGWCTTASRPGACDRGPYFYFRQFGHMNIDGVSVAPISKEYAEVHMGYSKGWITHGVHLQCDGWVYSGN